MEDKIEPSLEKRMKDIQEQFISFFSGLSLKSLRGRRRPLLEKDKNGDVYLDPGKIKKYTRDFIGIFPKRPVKNNTGGGGLAPNYWLFLIARLLEPQLIVESGVWKGQTSWLLRQACPGAEIHAFDISLKNLEHKDDSIFYHEQDWMQMDMENKNPKKGLVFFDDHINQAKRVREAYERGFKRLIFDDNVPMDQVDRIGIPPFPTIGMLFNKDLKEGDIVSWQLKGRDYTYTYSLEDTYGARELIADYFVFPTYTCLTWVELK